MNAPSALSPVVICVAHAGRDDVLLADLARVPPAALRPLEDRYADRLVDTDGAHRVVAFGRPRAWIDVNRAPHDLDSSMVAGATPRILSQRARGGLGLVPRRLAGVGELWRRPLARDELDARLFDYRAFHSEVEMALAEARAMHGRAVLLDVHSMPPLATGIQLVVGDAHGASAGRTEVEKVVHIARQAGLNAARNAPYAGGEIVRRHGRPAKHIHALQLEIDRSLYLDAAFDQPGEGLAVMRTLVADIADALAVPNEALPIAAE